MTAALATDAIDYVIRDAYDEHDVRYVQSVWSRCAKLPGRCYDAHTMARIAMEDPNARTPRGAIRLARISNTADVSAVKLYLDPHLVYRMHARLVDEILPKASLVMADLRRTPGMPIGFAVYEGSVLHYVYVAPDSRRAGIGRQLALHTRCSTASHVTPEGARLLRCLSGYAS